MALRTLLLGLVAGMGLEIPSEGDISCWARSGREWAQARLAEPSMPRVEADPALAVQSNQPIDSPAAVECPEASGDRAFEVASEGMAADFAADMAAIEAPKMAEVEVAPAVGLPVGEEMPGPACLVVVEDQEIPSDQAGEIVAGDDPAEVMDGTDGTPSRADRLSSAVRLTGQAVQAWADLWHDGSEDLGPSR
jgi:hypothetical protein